jgi:hypothetical protein
VFEWLPSATLLSAASRDTQARLGQGAHNEARPRPGALTGSTFTPARSIFSSRRRGPLAGATGAEDTSAALLAVTRSPHLVQGRGQPRSSRRGLCRHTAARVTTTPSGRVGRGASGRPTPPEPSTIRCLRANRWLAHGSIVSHGSAGGRHRGGRLAQRSSGGPTASAPRAQNPALEAGFQAIAPPGFEPGTSRL